MVPTAATIAEMARGRYVAEMMDRRFSKLLFPPAAAMPARFAKRDHPKGSPGAL
ncbi:MAG: hypothetical protein ACM3X8_07680 [Methanomicrobiales archaeon]